MALIKLYDNSESGKSLYYEFDPETRPLGEGGMGKVFRGTRVDLMTGVTRPVAIKFMFDGLPPSVIERARREANIKIKHENLVEMMGFLTTESEDPITNQVQRHYHVVSELLDGVVLSDLLEGVVTGNDGQVVPFAEKLLNLYRTDSFAFAVMIVKNVLSGVMTLHDKGYIHRDIDPSNIMVTRDNKIKLIDFGIAKQVTNLATQDKALTSTGQFMGKAQYAAPELILGDVAHQNKTTDIYAIGIMLFQLITGSLPFDGPTNQVIGAQLKKQVPVKKIPNAMARKIILKATNKDQTQRFSSAAEFRVAVEKMEGSGNSSSFGDKLSNIFSPRIWGGIAAVLAIAAAIFFGAKFLGGGGDADSEAGGEEKAIEEVKSLLSNPISAKDGFNKLQDLANRGDSEGQFLLSRLYCSETKDATEEVIQMKNNVGDMLKADDSIAHGILLQLVQKDPKNYKALFELGIDYYRGQPRSGNESEDTDKAKDYFKKALAAAKEAGDAIYETKANTWLEKY